MNENHSPVCKAYRAHTFGYLEDWEIFLISLTHSPVREILQSSFVRASIRLGNLMDTTHSFPCSSAVEQSTVNRLAAGSNPAGGAIVKRGKVSYLINFDIFYLWKKLEL